MRLSRSIRRMSYPFERFWVARRFQRGDKDPCNG